MDASELGRWTRFAGKGGIGKCTALQDCIAEEPQDLMFMKVSTFIPHYFVRLYAGLRPRHLEFVFFSVSLSQLTHTLCLGASMHMLQMMRAPVRYCTPPV